MTNNKNIQKNFYQKYKMDSENDVRAPLQHFALNYTGLQKNIIFLSQVLK
jgi:hypothetical protein